MNIPKFAIHNYQFTLLAFLCLFLLGLNAFLSMPRSEDPEIEYPFVSIVAVYPGANPEDMESQVVDIVEEAVNEIDDIKDFNSNIQEGIAVFELEFIFGVDPDEKFDEVQAQLNSIRRDLPDGLYELEARKVGTNSVSVLQLALISETASYGQLEDEGERLKDIIEKVAGVRKVEVVAFPEREVRIALDPVKMSKMNISLDDVENAIRSNNANIPGGAVKVSKKTFNVRTSGAFEDLKEVRNTVVGSYMGKLIYLKNIADVKLAYEDERYFARYNGEKAIFVTAQKKEGKNVFSVVDPIKEKLAATTLPEGMRLEYVVDQTASVSERLQGFLSNLMQGILLVGVLIFLVLGYRSSSLVMMAIPLSILIGLLLVNAFGFGLQQMSIAGLVVALGLLVDNSIAINENIERFIGKGFSAKEAAIKGTNQLVAPITSATLTTILAFVPIIMMPDTTGAFIKALPVSVIATLVASLVVAVTLTPYLAARLFKGRTNGEPKKSNGTIAFRTISSFVTGPYRNTLSFAMRNRWLTISFAVLSLAGALALFPLVGVSFFPKAEKPQFRITVNLPNGSNLDATNEVMLNIEEMLGEYEEIDFVAANIGKGNPRIYYNVIPANYATNYGEFFVVLKEYDVKRFYELLDELRKRFANYSEARVEVREFVQGPPSDGPIMITVFGDDLDKLKQYAGQIQGIVEAHPEALNVDNPLDQDNTDLFFNINRDKAMMLGVPVFSIDRTIRSYVNGTEVGTYRDKSADEYEMVMRYDFDDRFEIKDFDKISVQSATGHFVPLKQLASMEFSKVSTQVNHIEMERVASVFSDITPGSNLDAVIADLRPELDALEWEEGYNYQFKGEIEKREESFGGLGMASAIAMLMIFGVLVIQFRSFVQPIIIFSALPLAIIGSILMLYINGVSFSFTAFIGLTSLIGIAINNSIVLVDFANRMMAEGMEKTEAIKNAAEVRFMPIFLTTVTTILGLLPLTLAGGSMWAPMGWTIIGGLLTSTFFVLLLVPILYQFFTPGIRQAEA